MKNLASSRVNVVKPVESCLTLLEIMAQQNSTLSLNTISHLSNLKKERN